MTFRGTSDSGIDRGLLEAGAGVGLMRVSQWGWQWPLLYLDKIATVTEIWRH